MAISIRCLDKKYDKMQRCFYIHRWLLAVWMLCGMSHIALSAAFPDVSKRHEFWEDNEMATTSAYRATSTSVFSSPNSELMPGTGFSYDRSVAPAFTEDIVPAYDFHSSSSYATTAAELAGGMTYRAPRRSLWDDPDDYDPIGGVQDPQPIGEPLVLAIMALLYGAVLYLRRRRELTNNP